MTFLESVANALVDRSPEQLFGAVMVAAAVAVVMVCVFALLRRSVPPSATLVGGLVLAAGVICMTVTVGYIEYTERILSNRKLGTLPPAFPGWPTHGQGGSAHSGSPGRATPFRSPGFHVIIPADEDRDGRVTADELAHLVRKADANADGSVDVREIDQFIASRFRAGSPPGYFPTQSLTGVEHPNRRARWKSASAE
jgi:hypothetical protein